MKWCATEHDQSAAMLHEIADVRPGIEWKRAAVRKDQDARVFQFVDWNNFQSGKRLLEHLIGNRRSVDGGKVRCAEKRDR